ncbi:MAG: OmpA family protein [Pseudomonadota bacterium]
MIRALALALLGTSAQALTLEVPIGAELTREVSVEMGARAVPIGPHLAGETPKELAKGAIRIEAYRIPDNPAPSEIIAPLLARIEEAGFETLLSCDDQSCGGFDFRFSLELIPPPDMFVDLGNYLFFSAASPDGLRHVSVLASRSASDGYLHITQIAAVESETIDTVETPSPTQTAPVVATGAVGEVLENMGRVVLEDLEFPTGTTALPEEEYPSLTALAAYLRDNPDKRVALVGHTDASGALDVNIAISKRRAQAARTKLIQQYGIPANQVEAEGMGYLAPRASNLTEEGREQNRRVEVIITSTQ